MFSTDYYSGKTVFVTGHTGFKGSWLCKILNRLGATVVGYSLDYPTDPCLFSISNLSSEVETIYGDIRNHELLLESLKKHSPDVVFHLAAQPLVRKGYDEPRTTFETNVMGTVNLLESIRVIKSVQSVLNITTDKVYKNEEWEQGYRETDRLGGYDPYSNSKSCSELVTKCYAQCFLNSVPVSTARAGNVIGGGDFAEDRIIPDCVRSASAGTPIPIRNPNSVRPYQHVLEPLFAYLMIAERQAADPTLSGEYNIGPDDDGCVCTENLVKTFCKDWGGSATYRVAEQRNAPHESNYLKLDCSKIKQVFGWRPGLNIHDAVRRTVEWSKAYVNKEDVNKVMDSQIDEYMRCIGGGSHER
jgi:CDP-glucose 4,6-dehydratase